MVLAGGFLRARGGTQSRAVCLDARFLIVIYCAEAERSLAMEPGMMIAVIVGGLVAAGVAVYAGIQGAKKKDDDKK